MLQAYLSIVIAIDKLLNGMGIYGLYIFMSKYSEKCKYTKYFFDVIIKHVNITNVGGAYEANN